MATFIAVPYQLYSLTGSALQVGLLSICDAVPLLAFAAVGGTIADRFDRRKVVLWADIGLMAVVALLAVNAFAGTPQVWALYVLAFVATSSPGPIPSTTSARWSAAVPLDSATACGTPACRASSASNASTCGPSGATQFESMASFR